MSRMRPTVPLATGSALRRNLKVETISRRLALYATRRVRNLAGTHADAAAPIGRSVTFRVLGKITNRCEKRHSSSQRTAALLEVAEVHFDEPKGGKQTSRPPMRSLALPFQLGQSSLPAVSNN
jgi:hypothetical protein